MTANQKQILDYMERFAILGAVCRPKVRPSDVDIVLVLNDNPDDPGVSCFGQASKWR
jgi:hypothetical protein